MVTAKIKTRVRQRSASILPCSALSSLVIFERYKNSQNGSVRFGVERLARFACFRDVRTNAEAGKDRAEDLIALLDRVGVSRVCCSGDCGCEKRGSERCIKGIETLRFRLFCSCLIVDVHLVGLVCFPEDAEWLIGLGCRSSKVFCGMFSRRLRRQEERKMLGGVGSGASKNGHQSTTSTFNRLPF